MGNQRLVERAFGAAAVFSLIALGDDSMMDILRWALGIVTGVVFVWLALLNWGVFWVRHIRKQEAPSWIPLVGGISGVVSCLVMPPQFLHAVWFVPLVVDWGSLPGIVYSLICLAQRRV